MFRMNGMPRAQEAQERLLSDLHSVMEVATESPVRLCVAHRCALSQSTVHPEHNSVSRREVLYSLGGPVDMNSAPKLLSHMPNSPLGGIGRKVLIQKRSILFNKFLRIA